MPLPSSMSKALWLSTDPGLALTRWFRLFTDLFHTGTWELCEDVQMPYRLAPGIRSHPCILWSLLILLLWVYRLCKNSALLNCTHEKCCREEVF